MAKTLSSSMSCLANEIAFSGLLPESLSTSSIWLPPIPPFLLASCTSISKVLASGPPRLAAGPVTLKMAPILMVGPLACVAPAPSRLVKMNVATIPGVFMRLAPCRSVNGYIE